MSHATPSRHDVELTRLIAAARNRLATCLSAAGDRWLLVDVQRQRLWLVQSDRPVRAWPVSTAAAGVAAGDGSGGTPPGVHRIGRMIGHDAPGGTIFVDREPTGEIWPQQMASDERRNTDLILTRILTLDGCEEGVNRGPGHDSAERYIYIHGTNHEDLIGTPCSYGCVRLTSTHVQELFALVAEGDPVVIA